MATGLQYLLEEHRQLAQAWLESERARMDILEKLLQDSDGKCTMDYPEDFFGGYEEALTRTKAANRDYVQWLARQGFPSK